MKKGSLNGCLNRLPRSGLVQRRINEQAVTATISLLKRLIANNLERSIWQDNSLSR